MVVISKLPLLELATFSLIVAVLVLSFLSLAFILHFRKKSLASPPLLRFSSLWTVRILLISTASLWSLSQLIPIFGRSPLLCQLHVTLSLGFLEPSILLTLLFHLNSSTKPPPCASRVFLAVLFSCLPMLVLQTVFVFFSPFDDQLSEVFTRSSYTAQDGPSQMTVCTYPMMSTIVFGCFGVMFWMGFALSCFKIIRIVINKGLLLRTRAIALGVLLPLPIEILFLGLSVLWIPGSVAHSGIVFGVFLCTLVPAVAGEGILVIRPIVDALAVGGPWNPSGDYHGGSRTATTEEGGEMVILNQVNKYGSMVKADVPKGCVAVSVGHGGEQKRRFVVPVDYVNHPLFARLLKEAEEEYGFDQKGLINIPCHVEEFRSVQEFIVRENEMNNHHHNRHHK